MVTHDRTAARLLHQLSEAVEPEADTPEVRARTVGAIDAALGAPVSRRQPGRRWLAAAAGVALGAAGLLAASRTSPAVEVPPPPLEARTLTLASGATLSLGEGTRFELLDAQTRVLLREGEVAAELVRQELLIETTDTQVYARDAQLSVSTGAGCDGRSLVVVTAGTATVRSGGSTSTLLAGHHWPSCEAAAPGVEPWPMPASAPVEAKEEVPPPPRPEPAPRREPRRLSLAAQNGLYERALAAQRAGEVTSAVSLLEQLLRGAPTSPLAETALTQQFRWLKDTQPEAAREAAKRYLTRFPMGSARAEAEALVE